jgi:hypothetical protein
MHHHAAHAMFNMQHTPRATPPVHAAWASAHAHILSRNNSLGSKEKAGEGAKGTAWRQRDEAEPANATGPARQSDSLCKGPGRASKCDRARPANRPKGLGVRLSACQRQAIRHDMALGH